MLGKYGILANHEDPQQFLHAVAGIALSQSGDGRIHGDHQCGKSCAASPVDRALCRFASSHQIQLIPARPLRRCFHILQLMAGDGRENVARASFSRGVSGRNLTVGMHQSAVSNRRQHRRESEFVAEHLCLQVTIANGHRAPRTKKHIAKCAAVFRQRKFALGTAIQIIKHRPGKPALRHAAQIFDIDDS